MTTLAVDTWAFFEIFQDGPLADEVQAVLDESDFAFTTREIVVESFAHVVRLTGGTRLAKAWWDDLREGPVRVFEPPLDDVHAFVTSLGARGSLSLADLSLGFVARREKVTGVVTGDAEFRRLGLEPLFARR